MPEVPEEEPMQEPLPEINKEPPIQEPVPSFIEQKPKEPSPIKSASSVFDFDGKLSPSLLEA